MLAVNPVFAGRYEVVVVAGVGLQDTGRPRVHSYSLPPPKTLYTCNESLKIVIQTTVFYSLECLL